MQHIQGISRNQLQMSSLEDKITVDNPVRFIEAWNPPYKRKTWLFIKTTYLKRFLAQIGFGTNQNKSKFRLA